MSTQQRAAGNACPTAAFSFDPARLAQRRRWAGAFAALCGLALSPSALLAEEHSQHQDHAVELAPSVVTGVAQSSPLTIVTNPKEPRQPVPASDGADYLKTIPGFAVIRNGGSNGDPVLRGMFGSRLNILTNGGMMLGACPNRMDAPTSYISPETYDKLTVIKGPQTVLWGRARRPGRSSSSVSRSASANSARGSTPACWPAPTAASTRCWTPPPATGSATCASPATTRSPTITRTAPGIPCRRAGRSGTATSRSAGP